MYVDIYCRLLFPPLGDLPDPQIEPTSPVSPALQARSFPSERPVEAFLLNHHYVTMLLTCKFWEFTSVQLEDVGS